MKADVHDNVADLSLFDFSTATVKIDNISYTGWSIAPKRGIVLSGKITLPSYYDNSPIVQVQGFHGQTGLTHVFWERNCQLKSIYGTQYNNGAFGLCSNLEYFEFPDSLCRIGQYSFYSVKLDTFNFNDGLREIGNGAFQGNAGFVSAI
jgi:hypothetical protein